MLCQGKTRGLTLGNYLLTDKLGQGGMGMVFKAVHRRMKRQVALKVLSPELTKDDSMVERFQREVEAAARLVHPNILAAYDADEAEGVHFLVMEYVDGVDLSSLVKKQGALPAGRRRRRVRLAGGPGARALPPGATGDERDRGRSDLDDSPWSRPCA